MAITAADPLATLLDDAGLLRGDLFVDGAWRPASDGGRFAVVNPADREAIGAVASATREDVKEAVAAAERAFPAWAALTAKERGTLLRRWYDLIVAAADDLAAILTAEEGKPLPEARGAGLPAGVFNVVPGSAGVVGDELAMNPSV